MNNERYGKVRRNSAFQQGHGKTFTACRAFVCNNLSKQRCLRHYLWLCNHSPNQSGPSTWWPTHATPLPASTTSQVGGSACSRCHFGLTATAQMVPANILGVAPRTQPITPSLNALRTNVKQYLNTLRHPMGQRRSPNLVLLQFTAETGRPDTPGKHSGTKFLQSQQRRWHSQVQRTGFWLWRDTRFAATKSSRQWEPFSLWSKFSLQCLLLPEETNRTWSLEQSAFCSPPARRDDRRPHAETKKQFGGICSCFSYIQSICTDRLYTCHTELHELSGESFSSRARPCTCSRASGNLWQTQAEAPRTGGAKRFETVTSLRSASYREGRSCGGIELGSS